MLVFRLALKAIPISAAAVAAVFLMQSGLNGLIQTIQTGSFGTLARLPMALAYFSYIGLMMGIAYAVGLVVIGAPAAVIAHRLKFRHPVVGAVLGGLVSFIVACALIAATAANALADTAWFAATLIAPGAAAGWIMNNEIYGALTPPPAPPA